MYGNVYGITYHLSLRQIQLDFVIVVVQLYIVNWLSLDACVSQYSGSVVERIQACCKWCGAVKFVYF